MAAGIAGKFIPAVKSFIKKRASKAVAQGAPTVREALVDRGPQQGAALSTLSTLVGTGNPLAAATTGALDFGISAVAAPKIQRAMLASKNPLVQAAAGPTARIVEIGSTVLGPEVITRVVNGGQAPPLQQVPTTIQQNTGQAISDPTNKVSTQNALVGSQKANNLLLNLLAAEKQKHEMSADFLEIGPL